MRKRTARNVLSAVLILIFSVGVIALSAYLDMLILHSDLPGWLKHR